MSPTIRLYDWPVSPFCHKVRAVLEHKRLPYQRLPAIPNLRKVQSKGGIGKVPALELDGEFHVDSTDIVHMLEKRFPDWPVLPPSAEERAQSHVIEDWCDEALYFFGLYYHWLDPAGRRVTIDFVGKTLMGKLLYPVMARRISKQLWGHGLSRKTPAHIRSDLDRNLEAIEQLLSKGDFVLGASGPWLCDYALLTQLLYLSRAAGLAGVVQSRPRTAAFLERMKQLKESRA